MLMRLDSLLLVAGCILSLNAQDATVIKNMQHLLLWDETFKQDGSLFNEYFSFLKENVGSRTQAAEVMASVVKASKGVSATNFGNETSKVPAKSYNVSEKCMDAAEVFLEDLLNGKTYVLSMLDATGKPGSNILRGNTRWLGSYSECRQIPVPPSSRNTTFQTQYCSVTIANSSTYVPAVQGAFGGGLSVGVCVPDACSSEDVQGLVNAALMFLPDEIEAVACPCQTDRDKREFSTTAVGVICMLAVLGALLLCGSIYDLLTSHQSARSTCPLPDVAHASNSMPGSHVEIGEERNVTEYTPLIGSKNIGDQTEKSEPPVGCRLLRAFSVFQNGDKILTVGPSSDKNLAAIHGIRFLSMSWVLLGHTYAFSLGFSENLLAFIPMAQRFAFQAILNASVSVDSFFVLSGTLVAYLLLKEMEAKNGPRGISWWKFYFHRYWRLTPPYMLVLATYVGLFVYTGEGPNWPSSVELYCMGGWWQNLLYINNFFRFDQNCMAWSWYLANDMQFFLISPLLIIPFVYSSIAGVIINVVVLVASTITTWVITQVNNYPADFPMFVADPMAAAKMGGQFDDVYTKPWCRIGPYIIGILLGFLLQKTDRKINMHWLVACLGWTVAAGLNIGVLYGLYNVANGHVLSAGVNAFYAAFHRSVWAAGLAWVIFACCTGHGGPVNRILSWSALVPLSRLTYMVYLVHPIVINYYLFSLESLVIISDINLIYLFMGHMVVSHGVAFVCSLSFEAPMIGLEKILLGR